VILIKNKLISGRKTGTPSVLFCEKFWLIEKCEKSNGVKFHFERKIID
jgi:hypothetical protein